MEVGEFTHGNGEIRIESFDSKNFLVIDKGYWLTFSDRRPKVLVIPWCLQFPA